VSLSSVDPTLSDEATRATRKSRNVRLTSRARMQETLFRVARRPLPHGSAAASNTTKSSDHSWCRNTATSRGVETKGRQCVLELFSVVCILVHLAHKYTQTQEALLEHRSCFKGLGKIFVAFFSPFLFFIFLFGFFGCFFFFNLLPLLLIRLANATRRASRRSKCFGCGAGSLYRCLMAVGFFHQLQ
jgi:hypothetical protein